MADILKEKVAAIGDEWAKNYLANRIAYFKRRSITNSGELEQSMGYEVGEDPTSAAIRLLVAFADHGRLIDMRRINHDQWGRNAIERLEAWILKRGLAGFVPGFIKKYNLKAPPSDVVNRIAWGIMVARSDGNFRRRPWYAKSKTAALTELYNLTAASMIEAASDQITESLNQ